MSGQDDGGAAWPEPAIVAITVPDDAQGIRLDRFLATPLGSRARAQSLIDAGRVRVDGRPRAKRHAVSAGERIGWASTTRRGWSSIRPAGTGPGRWRRRWPAVEPEATRPGGRDSCTGWTATRPARWWGPRGIRSIDRKRT